MKFVLASDTHFGNHASAEGTGPFTIADHLKFAQEMHAEKPEVMVVAGDCAETCASEALLGQFFSMYKNPHGVSICVPGNHDCWLSRNSTMSAREKYDWFFKVAKDNGWVALRDEPWSKDGVYVAGNMGWYDFSTIDPETRKTPEEYERWREWSDYDWMRLDRHSCKDKTPMIDFCAERLAELDVCLAKVPADRKKLVVVTHVVGFQRLQRWFRRPDEYRAYMGCEGIGERVLKARADLYYCGHTHRHERHEISGVTCINNGSGYGLGSKRYDVIEV